MRTFSLRRFLKFNRAARPSSDEVNQYAQIILEHEHQPASAWAACQREAELQLWAMRAVRHMRGDGEGEAGRPEHARA